MEIQEPEKVLVQFKTEDKYIKLLKASPEYHKGLTAHLARKGFLKEVEAYLNRQQEQLAS